MSVSLSQWVSAGGGVEAVNLGNAQLLSVTGSGSAWHIQALVAGTEYTLDGPTYTTSALASAAILSIVNAVTLASLSPDYRYDTTVTTGGGHDV